LSSALLYVAIVAIWAGVLIPRWLRRDSSDKASDDDTTTVPDTPVPEETPAADAGAPPGPAEARPGGWDVRPDVAAARGAAGAGDGRGEAVRRSAADQEHARVLSARRRLLMLLLGLAAASCVLADTRLAAWWVMAPPAAMLLGYLALLREAAKADAERRDLVRPTELRIAAKPPTPAYAAPPAYTAPPAYAAPPAAPVPPAPPAPPAPDAEIIDISASMGQDGGEPYDQYADAKLRAVGD